MANSLCREKVVLDHFIGHPEIIQCIGLVFTQEQGNFLGYNLILEYAAGGTLADLIERKNKLPEEEAKEYLRMILRGLAYVHEIGYVHSDLQPTNIFAFPTGEDGGMKLKIADFGLATRYRHRNKKPFKQVPRDCGMEFRATLRYMSPESLTGDIKPPLDIWSLGCILINMVSGERVWNDCEDNGELISKLQRKQMPKIPTDLSRRGRDFLQKCFERDPQRRWTANMLLLHPYLTEEEPEDHDSISAQLLALLEVLTHRFYRLLYIF